MVIQFETFQALDAEYIAEMEYSTLFNDLNIQFEEMCGSSYSFGNPFGTGDFVEENWMVSIPPQELLFTLDSVRKTLTTEDDSVNVRKFINPDLYQIVFFVNPKKPREWFGFACLSKEEYEQEHTYYLRVELEMIYVLPQFRNGIRGEIMAYELGRLLSEQKAYGTFNDSIQFAHIDVAGQGVNERGRACLEKFYEGICFHLADMEDIQSDVYFCDEY